MVKVRILKPDRIYHAGRLQPSGAILEVDEETGKAWVNLGFAKYEAAVQLEREVKASDSETGATARKRTRVPRGSKKSSES